MTEGGSAGSLPPHQTKTRTPHESRSPDLAACYSSSTKRARFMALINRRCQIPGDESETDRHTATANLNRAELNSIPRNMQSFCNRRVLSSLIHILGFTSVLTFNNDKEPFRQSGLGRSKSRCSSLVIKRWRQKNSARLARFCGVPWPLRDVTPR